MKLNPAYIESQVVDVKFAYEGTLTVAMVKTKAGITLTGTSACLDPKNYDRTIGEQMARKDAVEQLWALEGYFFGKMGLAESDTDPRIVDNGLQLAALCRKG